MTRLLGTNIINGAIELRKKGNSLKEISDRLNIAKSTASLWLKNIELDQNAKIQIEKRQSQARSKASQTIKNKVKNRQRELSESANKMILKLNIANNPHLCKLFCSLLYWGEGNKTGYRVGFTNSDPIMIKTFIKLFRQSFSLDESKLRALVHIHEYHIESEIKKYWSKITNIPLSQFTKSYLKPHTGRIVRQEYKGTLRITYADTRIVDEIKAVYNELAKSLGM